MNRIERLSIGSPEVLEDGELPTLSSIVDQYDKLTKEKGKMSPDEVMAFISLSARLVDIKIEKDTRKSASFLSSINPKYFLKSKYLPFF